MDSEQLNSVTDLIRKSGKAESSNEASRFAKAARIISSIGPFGRPGGIDIPPVYVKIIKDLMCKSAGAESGNESLSYAEAAEDSYKAAYCLSPERRE